MSLRPPFFPLLILLALFSVTGLAAGREEFRYTVLMAGTPVGTVTDVWEERKTPEDCVVTLTSDLKLSVARGESTLSMRTRTVADADCGTYRPRALRIERDEGGGAVVTTARLVGNQLISRTVKNGVTEEKKLTIDDTAPFFGMIFRRYRPDFFLKQGTVPVITEEGLATRQISFSGKRNGELVEVELLYEGIPFSFTLRNGAVIRSVLSGGLLVYELQGEPSTAQKTAASPPVDLLAATAIENSGLAVKEPRRVMTLSLTLQRPAAPIPATCAQRVAEGTDGLVTVRVDHGAKPCPATPRPEDIAVTLYEDHAHPEIRKIADRWKGLTDRAAIAEKIIRFAYDHITDKNYRHGTLSASETLAARSGDCTEHTALTVALLRARGVPARSVYGLVLSDRNRFFFHNWAEIHTGVGWVPADPTFRQFPADAARIVIAYGGGGAEERETLALTVLKFLQGTRIAVTGFGR